MLSCQKSFFIPLKNNFDLLTPEVTCGTLLSKSTHKAALGQAHLNISSKPFASYGPKSGGGQISQEVDLSILGHEEDIPTAKFGPHKQLTAMGLVSKMPNGSGLQKSRFSAGKLVNFGPSFSGYRFSKAQSAPSGADLQTYSRPINLDSQGKGISGPQSLKLVPDNKFKPNQHGAQKFTAQSRAIVKDQFLAKAQSKDLSLKATSQPTLKFKWAEKKVLKGGKTNGLRDSTSIGLAKYRSGFNKKILRRFNWKRMVKN